MPPRPQDKTELCTASHRLHNEQLLLLHKLCTSIMWGQPMRRKGRTASGELLYADVMEARRCITVISV